MSDKVSREAYNEALDTAAELAKEVDRLRGIIDSRPAINAALPDSYVIWSQSIYMMEIAHASKRRAN